MEGGFVYKVVALTVFVLIAATVLIPVVEDVQDNPSTDAANTGYDYRMEKTGLKDLTLTIKANSGYVSVNNVQISMESLPNQSKFVLFTDTMLLTAYNGGAAMTVVHGAGYGAGGISDFVIDFDVDGTYSATYTIGGNDTTITGTYSYIVYANNSGSLGVFAGYSSVWLENTGAAYLILGGTNASNVSYYATVLFSNNASTTVYDYIYNGTMDSVAVVPAVSSSNVYSSELNFTASMTYTISGTTSTDSNPAYNIIAPITYKTVDTNDPNYSLLGIIPLMVIIAAVMMAVALMKGRN